MIWKLRAERPTVGGVCEEQERCSDSKGMQGGRCLNYQGKQQKRTPPCLGVENGHVKRSGISELSFTCTPGTWYVILWPGTFSSDFFFFVADGAKSVSLRLQTSGFTPKLKKQEGAPFIFFFAAV